MNNETITFSTATQEVTIPASTFSTAVAVIGGADKDIEMRKQESNLQEKIAAAIKEEILAEAMFKKAKAKVKEAKELYQEFLDKNRAEIAMPLLQKMITSTNE